MICPPEDRIALEGLLVGYAHAVDSFDADGICAVFTPDAVFDLSGVGYPALKGHDAIRAFFAEAFAAISAQGHYLSNFAVTAYTGDTASVRAYITGMARYKAGGGVTIHGRYYFDVARAPEGWKATRYTTDFLLPLES
ncbi:nuclear transport factor 2 family protein [Novosphingobium sp. Leaf2]|uniref:nuclear transport factor 2 family protein n=1 Tax=Novosphingobium sp. Leaf2 TaxID=1735670 RepID=UPI0006FD6398|nr:nuclear transport factor 2 family protein [Novosphingobium sp. Leaf2]KQM19383.1 ketosteroid isomerase [Novosphingobium sp. Leaf2]